MGINAKQFVTNISWVGASSVIGIVPMFIVNIFASRLLGPTEYGKYSLIISLGQIFTIPMIIGLNTSTVNYISSSKTKRQKRLFARNTLLVSSISIILSTLIFFILRISISNFLKVDNQVYSYLLIFSFILAFKYIFEAIIKGFHKFKLLSLLEVTNSISVFIFFFIILIVFQSRTFINYLIPASIGLGLYGLVSLIKSSYLIKSIKLNKKIIYKLLGYSRFVILGSLSGIALNNMDKFIINKYLSLSNVGIYSIYLSSSSFIGNYIIQVFVQVFFPTASAIKDKRSLTLKIGKLMFLGAVPIILINILSTTFILTLAGNQYIKNIFYILSFSFLSMLTIFSNIFWWLVASQGKKGIKFTSIVGSLLGVINILMMLLFVQIWGIYGIIFSLILTNSFMIISSLHRLNTHEQQS